MLFGEGPQIKNIAADLNKLFRQGSLLNQSGQTVEGDSTADQGTSDLLAARDPVIQEISVGMSGEQSARYTVSGAPPLSLPNSLGKPLKAWEVALSPYQEGSGDPAPDNVRPIHGTDKLTITTAGMNLADQEHMAIYTRYARLGYTDYYDSTPNGSLYLWAGTYTLSVSGVERWEGVAIINASGTSTALSYNNNSVSFTVATSGVYGIGIAIKTADFVSWDDIDIMLNVGNTSMPYEPYNGSQTVLTLPQTVYTGTIGSDGGESVDSAVDLGSLDWVYNSQNIAFYALVPDKAIGQPNKIMCEQYKPSSTTGFNLSDYEISVGAANSYVYIKDPRYSTVQDFKTAVSGVKLVYPLATPTTFAVPSPTIPTPTGTATTWATAEDGTVDGMEVTYVGKA